MTKDNIIAGWHLDAKKHITDNCDSRPSKCQIDALIIHAISLPPNEFGGDHIENFFCNTLDLSSHHYFEQIGGLKVSAHFLIKRTGELVQFVSTVDRAWHAGISTLMGQTNVNDFSIGIELEGCDTLPFEDIQYTRLASLTKELTHRYAIPHRRIVSHSEISPGRKTDPGPLFDWKKYFDLL